MGRLKLSPSLNFDDYWRQSAAVEETIDSRRLELQRGNSVGQTEFWFEEPAYHDVRQSRDVTD